MNIRILTEADYDELYRLWQNTPGMGLNDIDDTREGVARFLRRNPTTCFAAEKDGRMVGSILAGNDGRRGYIYHTAVAVSEREQGIGGALVDAAMDALEREGIAKAALVVFARNELGNRFWQNRGFATRDDIIYRNKTITDFTRFDT